MTPRELKQTINRIPPKPGIYIFSVRGGSAFGGKKILYIGKALNLKNRVKSYLKTDPRYARSFGEARDTRIQKMLLEAEKTSFIQTDSEIEALILESQYIKKYQPPFNIMLRDDKQYFYVGFGGEKFSRIFLTHQPTVSSIKGSVLRGSKNLNTKYLSLNANFVGPFTDGTALKTTLRLLRRIFLYCTCKQLHHNYCLNYHINKCPGFCCLKKPTTDNLQLTTYENNIKAIKDILSGKKNTLIKQLEKEMKTLSNKQAFEKAMELQYKIKKLKRVFQNAQIVNNRPDVMVYHNKNRILTLMQKELKLPNIPSRIEAYDIANIQGQHAVGVMVVFENGLPNKNEYRKFKIRKLSTSQVDNLGDTGMLKEVLTRRFNHSRMLRTPKPSAKEWPYPDLIVVDGGKGQLNATKEVLSIKYPVLRTGIIALTKNEKHIGEKIYLDNKKEALPLSKLPIDVKNLLLQIDSEAHRFAIGYYRKVHRKKALRP